MENPNTKDEKADDPQNPRRTDTQPIVASIDAAADKIKTETPEEKKHASGKQAAPRLL
jgi:hypothetical protein